MPQPRNIAAKALLTAVIREADLRGVSRRAGNAHAARPVAGERRVAWSAALGATEGALRRCSPLPRLCGHDRGLDPDRSALTGIGAGPQPIPSVG